MENAFWYFASIVLSVMLIATVCSLPVLYRREARREETR